MGQGKEESRDVVSAGVRFGLISSRTSSGPALEQESFHSVAPPGGTGLVFCGPISDNHLAKVRVQGLHSLPGNSHLAGPSSPEKGNS